MALLARPTGPGAGSEGPEREGGELWGLLEEHTSPGEWAKLQGDPGQGDLGLPLSPQVPVQSWFDDMADTELLNLIPIFEELSGAEDVYTSLGQLRAP